MSLNSLIQSTRPTVSHLVGQLRDKDMFVDNSFQRRLVWTEKQKVRLIETILMGYPMPEFYLWQQPSDADTGKQQQSIVDGQQRLTTMLQFVSNEWPLAPKYLDDSSADYASRKWMELSAELKSKFWDYILTARTIPSDVSGQKISEIFRRLNETDKSLNPQELRNAEFNGAFIQAAEQIADFPELKELKLFGDKEIRRMIDIQFASSLLMFLRRGLVEENLKTVNDTYDLYNDIYEERNEDLDVVKGFFCSCERDYLTTPEVRQFFSKTVHLFTLFCVDQALVGKNLSKAQVADKLQSFVTAYDLKDNIVPEISRYREAASSRTRSKASRSARFSYLLKWVLDN